MRSCWLMTLAVVMLLFLVDFGTSVTVSVSAADNPEYLPICNLPKCLNPRVTIKAGIGTTNATAEAKIAPEDAEKWCATYKPMDKYCGKEQVKNGWIAFRNLFRASADAEALLAASLALSAGIILLRIALAATYAREFTREALAGTQEAQP